MSLSGFVLFVFACLFICPKTATIMATKDSYEIANKSFNFDSFRKLNTHNRSYYENEKHVITHLKRVICTGFDTEIR